MEDVPWVVVDADCPYPELKMSLIEAFHSLSETYRERLESLQEKFCSWSEDNHLLFTFIVPQYTQDIPNYRSLCMDMLQRVFPYRSRRELLEHERKWSWQHFTQNQRRAVTQQWHRYREELLARALVTLQEAKHAHQEALDIHRDRLQQRDICAQLHAKVSLQQWRARQEEVARLEAAIAARQREVEEQRVTKEKERRAVMRTHQKQQVNRTNPMHKQAKLTIAYLIYLICSLFLYRVQFRADMLQRRREEREEREAGKQKEEEEKHKRLEALRSQVAVAAEADPERVMSDTESWRNRHENGSDFELQRPLYSIHTYTDTQIVSDPRVRIEQALRQADLHNTMYAREILSTIPPPKPPRKDTQSVIKL
uniref:Coiled-coil domain containing 148 n=1 Tax=Periophthalmus magnuspinnatus TaxID=409849 RepID=A0A3B3ZSN3_9GOBI